MKNDKAFHAPLHSLDTEKQTYGCRHTNPDICAKYEMTGTCAFAREDNVCVSPPMSWPKQFLKLRAIQHQSVMRLGQVCELIVDCEHKTAPTQTTGYPSIRTPNIGRGYFILDSVNRVSEDTYRLWSRRAVPKAGDLIMAREAPVGNVAMIPPGLQPCLGQRTLLIRPDRSKADPAYLTYLLLGEEVQATIYGLTNGATVAHLNMEDVRTLTIPRLPPLPIQRRIAGVLSAYDDLIDNNQRRIQILEQMSSALYREWFVEFRFPGHDRLESRLASPLGPIPCDWEVRSLADLMDIRGGSQPPKSEFRYQEQPGYVRLIQIRDYESDSHLTFVRESDRLRKCRPADVMIARYGASVARICWGLEGAYNVALAKVVPLIPNSREYLRQFLTSDTLQKTLIGMSGRAAQNGFNKSDIAAIRIAVPKNPDVLAAFEEVQVPLRDLTLKLYEVTSNLRRTRDHLLPWLLGDSVTLD